MMVKTTQGENVRKFSYKIELKLKRFIRCQKRNQLKNIKRTLSMYFNYIYICIYIPKNFQLHVGYNLEARYYTP